MIIDDPNAVHKARVALRRFRICVRGFHEIIDADTAEALETLARRHFRILSLVRDSDVLAENFSTHPNAPKMQQEAAAALKKARQSLKKKRAKDFLKQVTKRLAIKSWKKGGKKAKIMLAAPIDTLATTALIRSWKESESNDADLYALSARARHDLRKDLKSLRYLSEIFSELWTEAEAAEFLRLTLKLQDSLGALPDAMIAEAHGLTVESDAQTKAWLDKAAAG